jgi:proline iminopeptidase
MEQFVTIDGLRFWTVRHGSGPPLVLLHGGPGLWDDFDALAAMVDDLATVHRYDQRGSGRSEGGPPYDVATFVADLDALRQHWGVERWVVGGHSAGANLALAYAVAHPERVTGLLYMSGTGLINDWSAEYHANADVLRPAAHRVRLTELRALLRNTPEAWTGDLDREYCALTWQADFADRERAYELGLGAYRPYGRGYGVNSAMNAEWKRLLADSVLAARAHAIEAPVLVLHGGHDPRPARLAERLATSLPNATLHVIPQAGHWPWLEQPEPVLRIVRDFLTALS